jgi:hypothetical protein
VSRIETTKAKSNQNAFAFRTYNDDIPAAADS